LSDSIAQNAQNMHSQPDLISRVSCNVCDVT